MNEHIGGGSNVKDAFCLCYCYFRIGQYGVMQWYGHFDIIGFENEMARSCTFS